MKIKITQLSPDNWQQYKEIRLEAVKTDPAAFGMSYEEELVRAESQWQDFLKNMWFALVDNKVIGMIGLIRNVGEPSKHTAHIVSFWVKPEYRGQGVGKALIQALQEHAKINNIRKLYLQVAVTQESAIKLYEKMGFEKVGQLKEHTKCGNKYLDQYFMEWHNK